MVHTVSLRLSPETRALLRDNSDFFSAVVDRFRLGETPLQLLGKDPEAHTERQVLPNGDVQVTFVYPIDDNGVAGDGRIYLRDKFVFDPSEKILKGFARDFSSNSQNGLWRGYLEKYRRTAEAQGLSVYQKSVQAFALTVGRFHARSMLAEDGSLRKDLNAALVSQRDYLVAAGAIARGQNSDWKLKAGDPQSYYTLLRRGDQLEIHLHLPIDADASAGNGRIWLHERFVVEVASKRLRDFERSWELAPESAEQGVFLAAELTALNQAAAPTNGEAQSFIQALLPALLPTATPDYASVLSLMGGGPPKRSGSDSRRGSQQLQELQVARLDALETMFHLYGERLVRRYEASLGWARWGEGLDLAQGQSRLASLSEKAMDAAEQDVTSSPFALLQSLDLNQEERSVAAEILADPTMTELNALGQELDPELRSEGMLLLARARLFQREALLDSAQFIAQRMLKGEDPPSKKAAEELLRMLQGSGNFGLKAEVLLPRFAQEVTKPSMLAGMTLAPLFGTILEVGGLRLAQWISPGPSLHWGTRLLPAIAGIGGEAIGFTTVHKTWDAATEKPSRVWQDTGQEILASSLLFGGMRLAHLGSTWAEARMASGEWGTAFGRRLGNVEYPGFALTPRGRLEFGNLAPAYGIGAPTLSRLGQLASGTLGHLGGILTMTGSGYLSRRWGWMPDSQQGLLENFVDSAALYTQALVGAQLASHLAGSNWSSRVNELRLRFLSEQVSPANKTGVALPTIFTLRPETIPDVRLFDLNQGSLQSDFHFGSQGEAYLDFLLFGHEGNKVMLFRNGEGEVTLLDLRDKVVEWGEAAQNPHQLMNFSEQSLLLNTEPVPPRTRITLHEGDDLYFPVRRLKISLPRQLPWFADLASLPKLEQRKLAEQTVLAKNFYEWMSGLKNSAWPAKARLETQIQKVFLGQALLHSLPTELGIFAKARSLMEEEFQWYARSGFDDTFYSLKPAAQLQRWSSLEKSFHMARHAELLRVKLKAARDLPALMQILQQGPFQEIEGKSLDQHLYNIQGVADQEESGLQFLPYSSGIRQRVRDLIEQKTYRDYQERYQRDQAIPLPHEPSRQEDYVRLDRERLEFYEKLRTVSFQGEEARKFPPDVLEELAYQVLERGKPLALLPSLQGIRSKAELYQQHAIRTARELFPGEMDAELDPWTAENIPKQEREPVYRLALHVLNRHGRRPVWGVPSLREVQSLIQLTKSFLADRFSGDFLAAQTLLREHFDAATPQAQALLAQATSQEKALILHLYFGSHWRRDMVPGAAAQVATWFGQAGMYREVGVTYEVIQDALRTTLAMGNLGGVLPEKAGDFFFLHTHPQEYLTEEGFVMGDLAPSGRQLTLVLGSGETSQDTRNILPSQADLRLYFSHAQDYWRRACPHKFGTTPLYDASQRFFRNFVVHPLGLSEVRVYLAVQGHPQKAEIRFAARPWAKWKNDSYLSQKSRLEAMSKELGVPVEVREISYQDLLEEMPFSVNSLF